MAPTSQHLREAPKRGETGQMIYRRANQHVDPLPRRLRPPFYYLKIEI